MSPNPLTTLLQLLSQNRPLLSDLDCEAWPAGFIGACVEAGILVPAENARFIRCPNCDQPHDVEARGVWFNGTHCLVATCAETGVVKVDDDAIQQWCPSLDGLARLLNRGLGIPATAASKVDEHTWAIGHVVKAAQVLRVFLTRGAPNWSTIACEKEQVAVVAAGEVVCGDTPKNVVVIQLEHLVSWDCHSGISFQADLIHGMFGTQDQNGTTVVSLDGFTPPSLLVLQGVLHTCPRLKPQLQKLLPILLREEPTSIHSVVHKGAGAVWREKWDPKNKRLTQRIRTALNELKIALRQAQPSAHLEFSLRANYEVIERNPAR